MHTMRWENKCRKCTLQNGVENEGRPCTLQSGVENEGRSCTLQSGVENEGGPCTLQSGDLARSREWRQHLVYIYGVVLFNENYKCYRFLWT